MSKFIPQTRSNPVLLQKKLDKLKAEVSLHGKNIDAISKSHDNHITMLSNFARHDIKNSVQSMDSILSTNELYEFTENHIESLKLNLKIIRETINNFSQLVPYSENNNFTLDELTIAIELLNRESFYVNKVSFKKEIPEGVFKFNLPFQSVVQMINNIIINAIKAFENVDDKKIKFQADFTDESFMIKIYDNGNKIPFDDIDSIFDYGKSSSGGSGIGLYHARYLCNLYKGKIDIIELTDNKDYSKYFLINLPIINNL
ncbi:GHKL domain-containing protein [Myroides sp. M-43]|uniref:ATP-binding protein n=1 Tax=Myroides oncorhynchi TaxID=2893756 RepID=UPI001E3BB18D|nr:ATP-binding protein [Myroides oncorhynchi]MCC9043651.1 GHKL domain-containing protein [Myroides oncorhynchi]